MDSQLADRRNEDRTENKTAHGRYHHIKGRCHCQCRQQLSAGRRRGRGAIHKAAGSELLRECRQIGGCPAGEARITRGYRLPARFVIHTVGPVWRGGSEGEDQLLARCYQSCFALAEKYEIKSIAFPAISTGAYGFPIERACRIAIWEMRRNLEDKNAGDIIAVCFNHRTFKCYQEALQEF